MHRGLFRGRWQGPGGWDGIGMAWMAMEESEKHLKNTFFFQIFIEDFMRALRVFLAC